MKNKFLKLMALFVASAFVGNAGAQTDVTSTYLDNADFNGEYTAIYTINNDGRYIYEPTGWTVDYKNESTWNMTVVASTDKMASNFTGAYAVPTDNKRYMVRFRDNKTSEYIDLSQTITIQETGIYTFSADLIRENGSKVDVQLYAGTSVVSNANPGIWENRSFAIALQKDSEIKVGVKFLNKGAGGHKIGADNIKITYSPLATEEDYAALENAIADAETHTLGFLKGEYAPYNNVEVLTALTTAKAIDKNSDNSAEDITELTETLANATWIANEEEVNAVYDGDFALQPAHESGDNNVVLPGWLTESGNTRLILKNTETYLALSDANAQTALFVHPGDYTYGKTSGYTIPLKANTIYRASAKYCAWATGSNNNFTITIKDVNGNVVKSSSFGKVEAALTSEGALKSVSLEFMTGDSDMDYTLSLNANGNTAFTDIELYTAKTIDFEFKVDWGTLILPFAAEKPEGMEVYTCETENNGTLELVSVDKIEANTPYIVEKTGETTTFAFTTGIISYTEATHTSGLLTGTFESTAAPVGSYVLQKQNEVLGFYKVSEGKQPTVGAYRCYINASESAAPMFSLERGEGTTSIEDAELTNETVVIYDLAGRRVEKMEKGIYIVNGHKVIR